MTNKPPIPIPAAAIEAGAQAMKMRFAPLLGVTSYGYREEATIVLRAAAPHLVGELMEAAQLRRNVILRPERIVHMQGDWIAIPREDFDRLREALRTLEAA